METNIVYVGFLYTDHVLNQLLKLGSVIDYPGFNFQQALLEGLDANCTNVKVISSSYMSSFPSINKFYFKPERYSHRGDNSKSDLFVGLVNIPIIKNLSKFIRIRKALKKELLENKENIVILYELHTPFLLAVASLNKYYKHTCVIVPDLPEYMTESKNPIYLFLKQVDRIVISYLIKYFSSFVLFSEHMQEKLPIDGKPFIVMEGIYLPTKFRNIEKTKEKTILYTGNLSERSGIFNLIDAFSKIKGEEYRLWIRGGGNKSIIRKIEELSLIDGRITIIPRLTREELVELQKKATLLVNPTMPNNDYTRYFFPSKTMEYMASGTPTLMYKLDCIPKEYYPFLYFVPDESIETLSLIMERTCSKPQEELNDFGAKAADFISMYKTPSFQAKKIVGMIKDFM